MSWLRRTKAAYIVALISTVLGILIGLLIIHWYTGGEIGPHKKMDFQLNASFQDGFLIVSITNLRGDEVIVEMIFLEGKDHIDFDMPNNVTIKPGETVSVRTSIMQPASRGLYIVRVKLSNGRMIHCKITV